MNEFLFILQILIFPGFLFLMVYAIFAEWMDRKLFARMQNRVGPPLWQPLADLIKLFSKEVIIPRSAGHYLYILLPYFAFAAVVTAFFFIPVWSSQALYSYQGDLVVVAYLLTVPTLVLALSGWNSATAYSILGGIRCLTQLFAYEVPFFLALLTPALLLGTWNISEISRNLPSFLVQNPFYFIPVILSFLVGIVALQGKLERKPFDIPDAETELVAGPFTEYSGRLLAIFRLSLDMEMVVGASLLSAIFLGGANSLIGIPGFIAYLIKTLIVIFILAYIKAALGRIRIDQMISFGWKVLAPLSLLGMLIVVLFRKGGIL
ncbi:MAG: NADH-quinone oxidoreductase subunit H [Caldiserica bacterium]|jgi:NADH-quinone oxidoreductase subunit H|nr:NADH-quinone oxidoreductase subunit H [Caldisericota bacterium]MDH7562058.1 NADH-quinone oxidoreductase subunit H [Caldisericota bacterium]